MTRRLYLHIGTMKSGSTYLQALLDVNQELLSEYGLLWPTGDLRYRAVRELLGQRPGRKGRPAWRQVSRQVRRHPGSVVFSNELLAILDPDAAKQLVEAFGIADVRVIVTARSLVKVVPSHWQTKMRLGWTVPWTSFADAVCRDAPDRDAAEPQRTEHDEPRLEAPDDARIDVSADRVYDWFWRRQDVAEIVDRWRHVVPVEQITVVTVPAAGDPTVLARRFGEVIGADLTRATAPTNANPSLGAHSAELIRRLNERIRASESGHPRVRAKHGLAGGLIDHAAQEPGFALSPSQRNWVVARSRRMVSEIAATGVQVVGDLREITETGREPSVVVDPAASTDAELLETASSGLIALMERYDELRDTANEQADELRALRQELAAARRGAASTRRRRPPSEPQPGRRIRSKVRRLARAVRRS